MNKLDAAQLLAYQVQINDLVVKIKQAKAGLENIKNASYALPINRVLAEDSQHVYIRALNTELGELTFKLLTGESL